MAGEVETKVIWVPFRKNMIVFVLSRSKFSGSLFRFKRNKFEVF